MRLPYLDIFLVFRGAIAGQCRLVVGEFDHDVARAAFAFDGGEFAGTHHEAPTEFLEDGRVGQSIGLVAFVIVNVDARNPVSFCHFRSPCCFKAFSSEVGTGSREENASNIGFQPSACAISAWMASAASLCSAASVIGRPTTR